MNRNTSRLRRHPFCRWVRIVALSLTLLALAVVIAATSGSHAAALPPAPDPREKTDGAAATTSVTAAPRVPERLREWAAGLELLHAGRANEALDWFVARQRQRPDDLCGSYYPALVYLNWTLNGLEDEEELTRGRALLEQGIAAGEAIADPSEADPGTRYCLGAIYGLRAQDRLETSKFLRAAFDARRSRRIMLDLFEDEPGFVDCRFWLGSYDYFADVLPGIIKFFRTLLFFPSGDKERGLDALRAVADGGALDRYHAYWMLYEIHAGIERDEQTALEVLEDLHAAYPDSVDASLTLAWRLARSDPPEIARGVALHAECLERIESRDGPSRERLTERVKVSLGRYHVEDLNPAVAVEVLRPVLAAAEGEEREMAVAIPLVRALVRAGKHAEAVRVLEKLRGRYPDSSDLGIVEHEVQLFDEEVSRVYLATLPARRLGRDDRLEEAEAAFRELLSTHGEDAQIYFWMAGMYFDAGSDAVAEAAYRKALRVGGESPAFVLPWTYVRIGNLMDVAGKRAEAKTYYRKAIEIGGDASRASPTAKWYLKHRYSR